ncbi:hypothetical protein [Nocardioides gilvus]|uniref:hypothetical protein n=1 Tax=Nocardioides gilvus TaxID=1735589 RepID=UPI000D74A3A3|nr:hypothetical protein [Nocardioides gilvus]
MKIVRLAATLLIVGVALVGCGADEEEPEPSAQDKFCAAYRDFYEQSSRDPGASDTEVVSRMKEFAATLDDLEPPEEMSGEAKKGMAIWIEMIGDLPDDASQDDVVSLNTELSKKESSRLRSYNDFGNVVCLSNGASG